MTRSKGFSQKGAKSKSTNAKFKKIEYNTPLKYRVNAEEPTRRKVKLTYFVHTNGQIYNTNGTGISEKTVSVTVDTFDDGTEEEFLIFKRSFEEVCRDLDLEPEQGTHGAKHLYTLMKKALKGSTRDEWLDIANTTNNMTFAQFQKDLWKLTEQQIDDDSIRQQKNYLENTKKPRFMSSREWLNRMKVINSYLPRMRKN